MDITDVYRLVGMRERDPLALYNGPYKRADQEAMKNRTWDYSNPDFLCNKILVAIERLNPRSMTPQEHTWFRRLRWFWYHHAISCAVWKKEDQPLAQYYSQIAMRLQKGDHQTHITCILFHLVHDRPKEAKRHLRKITQNGPQEIEYKTGCWLIKAYEALSWPFPKPV